MNWADLKTKSPSRMLPKTLQEVTDFMWERAVTDYKFELGSNLILSEATRRGNRIILWLALFAVAISGGSAWLALRMEKRAENYIAETTRWVRDSAEADKAWKKEQLELLKSIQAGIRTKSLIVPEQVDFKKNQ